MAQRLTRLGISADTMVSYQVNILALAQDERVALVQTAIVNELSELGLHGSVEIRFTGVPTTSAPSVAVFFGSESAATDPDMGARIDEALNEVTTVIPVVDNLEQYASLVPDSLRPINGLAWVGATPAPTVARRVLEELGIEERQRKVFISHRRADGLLAAEQLFEMLSKRGFIPFIDRFNIPTGVDIQTRIADELEDYAFLLVLETPSAHESSWVYDEIDYALTHLMGLHIVRWPGEFPAVPATARLPRQVLASADVSSDGTFDQLTQDAIDAVVAEIEAAHAYAMVRRRRNLLRSVEDAAEVAGCTCRPLGQGLLLVQREDCSQVVQVASRLPDPADLHALDESRAAFDARSGVLVHASRLLRPERRSVLDWCIDDRSLTMVPENGIGGFWS